MKEESNYENLPLSEITLTGSNFNIDDLKVLKALNDRQDEVTFEFLKDTYDHHAKLICDEVRNMITEQNKTICKKIDEQNKVIQKIQQLLPDIQEELRDHASRLTKLESEVRRILKEHNSNHM